MDATWNLCGSHIDRILDVVRIPWRSSTKELSEGALWRSSMKELYEGPGIYVCILLRGSRPPTTPDICIYIYYFVYCFRFVVFVVVDYRIASNRVSKLFREDVYEGALWRSSMKELYKGALWRSSMKELSEGVLWRSSMKELYEGPGLYVCMLLRGPHLPDPRRPPT